MPGPTCNVDWASLVSAIAGGFIVLIAQWFKHWLETKEKHELNGGRKKLLRQMLDDPAHKWRKLETLARVVGASEDETARLLIDIGARGSETDDGLWGYIKDHPLSGKD